MSVPLPADVPTSLEVPLDAYNYVRSDSVLAFSGTLMVIGGRLLPFVMGAGFVTGMRAAGPFMASQHGVVLFAGVMIVSWAVRRLELLSIPFKMRILGRRLQRCSPGAALRRDRRRPVLFLRGFAADRDQVYQEAFFSEALPAIGPPIAIGDPLDGLPKDGFYRLYVPNGVDWQAVFGELAGASQLILIETLHDSSELLWEVERVFTSGLWRRTVLLVWDQSSYEAFVRRIAPCTAVQLPPFEARNESGLFSLVLFTSEGAGRFRHLGGEAFILFQVRQEFLAALQEIGVGVTGVSAMASASSAVAFLEFAGLVLGALGAYWFL